VEFQVLVPRKRSKKKKKKLTTVTTKGPSSRVEPRLQGGKSWGGNNSKIEAGAQRIGGKKLTARKVKPQKKGFADAAPYDNDRGVILRQTLEDQTGIKGEGDQGNGKGEKGQKKRQEPRRPIGGMWVCPSSPNRTGKGERGVNMTRGEPTAERPFASLFTQGTFGTAGGNGLNGGGNPSEQKPTGAKGDVVNWPQG